MIQTKLKLLDTNHINDLLADRFSEIVVNETETVSVIRRGKIVPDRNRNFILIAERNDIAEPVFAVFVLDMTNRTELTAGQDRIGMCLDKGFCGCETVI